MATKIKLEGTLNGDKVICTKTRVKDALANKNFGEKYDDYTVLDVYETLYLMETRNLTVYYKNTELPKNGIVQKILEETENEYLMHKYQVFKEIRDKGYIIKTGLKFGFDFRVYPKGKKIDEAHTEFVVSVIPQDRLMKNEDIARSVRMASGLHAKAVFAIVDNELETTYYSADRFKL